MLCITKLCLTDYCIPIFPLLLNTPLSYETVIEAMASGSVNAKQLITHRFPLERAMEAYNAALRREGVKIIVDCSRTET